jgi:hypothetical protein
MGILQCVSVICGESVAPLLQVFCACEVRETLPQKPNRALAVKKHHFSRQNL